jgi:epoxyqueuosine reductase
MAQEINIARLSSIIKHKAAEEGFFACGISPVHSLYADKEFHAQWVNNSFHGKMAYMEKSADKRANPRYLYAHAHSVISVMMIYRTPFAQIGKDILISKYAYGHDYHELLKKKLEHIVQYIQKILPSFEAIIAVDSSPVFEKRWAQLSGLGWRGKNTLLINPKAGSFFFLGEIITNTVLQYDKRLKNRCGNCTKCIDACPTDALQKQYTLDARKCIAYLTIENKDEFDSNTPADFAKYIYGCDICQDVCPWNAEAETSTEGLKEVNLKMLNLSAQQWLDLSHEEFAEMTKYSCIGRTGLAAMKRNVRHAMKIPAASNPAPDQEPA